MKTASSFLTAFVLVAAVASAQQPSPAPSPSPSPKPDAARSRLPVVVEEITVSASVASESDPASFASLTRDEIASRNRGQDLGMLLGDTPNAYAYSDAGNGVGYSYLSLRGFDQRRIAVNINGAPLNDPESHQVYFIDLADFAGSLQSLQVQRGTGTALYGSPAVGGVVNLETGALDRTRGGTLTLGAGSFGTYRGSFDFRERLGARAAFQVRLAHVRSDGYREPSWTRHSFTQLAYQLTGERSVLRVQAFGGPEKTQLAYYGVPIEFLRGEISGDPDRDRRQNPLRPGETDHFVQPHLQLLHDIRLRPGLLLKTTAYTFLGSGYFRQFSDVLVYDPLGGAAPSAQFPERLVADAWRRRSIDNVQAGLVPTLRWSHGRGELTAGLELRQHVGHHRGRVQQGELCLLAADDGSCLERGAPLAAELVLYDYRNRKATTGFFVREALRVGKRLTLTGELSGARHGLAMRDDRVRGYSWDTSYAFLTPRLGAQLALSSRWSAFLQLSTARSEPTFSSIWDPQDASANPRPLFERASGNHLESARARPERLRAAELGAAFQGPRASLKANLYLMDFRDELVYAGGIDDDGLPITDNAARSLHRGVELQGRLRLRGGVQLDGHFAASRDVLEDYTLRFGPLAGDAVDYSGNRIALFPTRLARLRAARGFGPLDVVVGVRHVGTTYLDNSQNEKKDPAARQAPAYVDKLIEPYSLADASLQLDVSGWLGRRGQPLVLQLAVDNLFDRRYVASGYAYGAPYFIPGATRSAYLGLRIVF